MLNTNSLVYRVLKAVYFPRCGLMEAPLGHRPSFTWHSLWGVRWVVEEGSRWRVGDGEWLPRPSSFKVVTPYNPQFYLLRVGDLIDSEHGTWRKDMVKAVFLPVDAAIILGIPLSIHLPSDRVVWHYSSCGELSA